VQLTLPCVARCRATYDCERCGGMKALHEAKAIQRDSKNAMCGVTVDHSPGPTGQGPQPARHEPTLRKFYRALMHFIGSGMCNGKESRTEDLTRSHYKSKVFGNRFLSSRSRAIEFAAQQSLRLDPTRAELPPCPRSQVHRGRRRRLGHGACTKFRANSFTVSPRRIAVRS
jgi:hypothetical protein